MRVRCFYIRMIGGSYIALTSRPNLLKTMPYSKVFVNCASRQRSVIIMFVTFHSKYA